jgi:hypothetical protein
MTLRGLSAALRDGVSFSFLLFYFSGKTLARDLPPGGVLGKELYPRPGGMSMVHSGPLGSKEAASYPALRLLLDPKFPVQTGSGFSRSNRVLLKAVSTFGWMLPLRHVQFWETENSWRLDSSYRGGHRRDIPCLVDASDVRTVNALKNPPAWSMSAGNSRGITFYNK